VVAVEVTKDAIMHWIKAYACELELNKDYLTALDGAIGDNDHGINMSRGFNAVLAALPNEANTPIDATLKLVGTTLIRTVGGAAGPLYGTTFLRMAGMAAGKEALSAQDLAAMLEAGQKGIADRGKAEPGDKTMLDAWEPATRAYREALSNERDLQTALQAAAKAAEQGMKDTIPLVARKGRASYLGERSAGHQDPGATSTFLLFKSLLAAVTGTPTE
jgi:dihydroxyacetone kinase-like protein